MLQLSKYRYGTPRTPGEGLRIGATRYLPRGVRKEQYARLNYFDVWFPVLAPSRELVAWFRAEPRDFEVYARRYRKEMQKTDSRQAIQLLAALARSTPISIGCYCADENCCHRSLLYQLIVEAAHNAPTLG